MDAFASQCDPGISDLIAANASLRERVAILEDRLTEFIGAPRAFNFAPSENRLFAALMKSVGMTVHELMAWHTHGRRYQPKQVHTILTIVNRMRRKLELFAIEINHDRGGCYSLSDQAKAKVRMMMREEGIIT